MTTPKSTNATSDEPVSLSLTDLIPDPRNARRHTDRNLAQIEAALQEVGAARSIVVDEHGTILAGNATVQAAKQVGIDRLRIIETDGTELVAVRRSGLTPEQKVRLALHDNRAAELAEWDPEMLAVLAENTDLSDLWETDELAELLGPPESLAEALVDPDLIPDPPETPITQIGDLWLLGQHRLLCGDSTDPTQVVLLMDGTRAPLMPTDPPLSGQLPGRQPSPELA